MYLKLQKTQFSMQRLLVLNLLFNFTGMVRPSLYLSKGATGKPGRVPS